MIIIVVLHIITILYMNMSIIIAMHDVASFGAQFLALSSPTYLGERV